jgi:hypothetical protein
MKFLCAVAVLALVASSFACKRPDPEQKDKPKPIEAGVIAPSTVPVEKHKGGSLEYLNRTRQKELLTPPSTTSAVDATQTATPKEPGKLEVPNLDVQAK